MKFYIKLMICSLLICSYAKLSAEPIHQAPVILDARNIRLATRFPIDSYRLFKTGADGSAIPIPFQIDELNQYGDYVLDMGSPVTKNEGNGIFDMADELSFMGSDTGSVGTPTKWSFKQPDSLFEIRMYNPNLPQGENEGAVYLGVYAKNPPPLSDKHYVVFDFDKKYVSTSRFNYMFDQTNYLLAKSVDMKDKNDPKTLTNLLLSSTFYMKLDLKYFLTFIINHNDIKSNIEAYKHGPIRTIVRVNFFYSFLKMNFELGMFTEISVYPNAVYLPAIMYNPLSQGTLNQGSGFYYGFAITDNPETYKFDTNLTTYKETSFLDRMFKKPKIESSYWLSMTKPDRTIYFEVVPSKQMKEQGNLPTFYTKNMSGSDVVGGVDNRKALPLGKSPVNLALNFDLANFAKGEHRVGFKLYFDNRYSEKLLNQYKTTGQWISFCYPVELPSNSKKEE